jgi:hypothetical protein
VSDQHCTKCGHDRWDHSPSLPSGAPRWPSCKGRDKGGSCRCSGWDVSRLPAKGERLELGKHRQRQEDAETAPAWPPLGNVR